MKKLLVIMSAVIIACTTAACSSNSSSSADISTSSTTEQQETTKKSTMDFNISKKSFDFADDIKANDFQAATIHVELSSLPKINLDISDEVKSNPNVTFDTRGAISLDAEVLFDYNSSTLSDKGKESIKSFLDDYVKAVFNDDGTTEVKKITVEGHTDTDGSHEYNQKLSEDRAKTVMDYCNEQHPELKKYLVAKGCSYDCPVLKDDGTVDMAASRRVCFVAE